MGQASPIPPAKFLYIVVENHLHKVMSSNFIYDVSCYLDMANILQTTVSSNFTRTFSKFMSCNSYLEREIYRQYYIHHIKCTHVFLQTTREIFASKHHHLSLHITIFFILDVANIFLITVIYEDIYIDIISYTIVFSCNPQEKYLHKNTVIYLS